MKIAYGFKTNYKPFPKMTKKDWKEIEDDLKAEDRKLMGLLFLLGVCILSIALIWA